MKRLIALALLLAATAAGAQQNIGNYPNATTPLYGTERFPANQSATSPQYCSGCTVDLTPAQIAEYVFTGGTGVMPVANGGTGATTAAGAMVNLLPSYVNGYCLSNNGSILTWIMCGGGSGGLTSVGLVAPSFLTVTGSPLTMNGSITLSYSGVPLPVLNGGTGATTATGTGSVVLSQSPALTTPNLGTPSAAVLTNATGLPLTTGVAGILAIANGGTGASTLAGASLPTFTGSITTGHCVEWASAVSIEDAGAACGSGGGGGNVSVSGVPAQYQTPVFASTYTIGGVGPGTAGQAYVSNGGSANPGFSSTLSDVTSVNGTTIPASQTLLYSGGALGTPSSGTATNLTGLPLTTGVTGILPLANGGTGATTLAGAAISTFSGSLTSGHCAQWSSSSGQLVDSGGSCGSGGSNAFSALTSSTNTTASMVVGSGASLSISGTGIVNANEVNGATIPATTAVLASNSSSALIAATTTGTGSTVVLSTSPTLTTPTLGVATVTSLNGNIFTTGTYTLTGSAGKTFDFTNSLTLSGTDSTTMTFPSTSGTVATLNSAQTFTAAKTFTNSDLLLLGSSTGANTFTAANASSTNYTTTVPANTGTLAETNLAQTYTAGQTFTNSDLLLLGSSTGYTTFTSGNASSSNYTLTVPANTGTLSELNLAQTWTAAQTFTNSDFNLLGSSTGYTTLASANASSSNYTLTLPANTGTLAELNLAQTWTALQTFGTNISIGGVTAAGATGTGNIVFATSPSLTTPNIGVATATSVNGSTVPSSAGTLAGSSGSFTTGHCLEVASTSPLEIGDNGSGCAATPPFSAITSATNTSAAMVVGTGASLATSGTGTIAATSLTTLSGLPSQANNTIVCNASGASASPTACSAATAIGALTSGTPDAQTGTTYTLVIGDANGEVTMANASANTLTIPTNASVAFNVGTVITVQQLSTGLTTVSPASGVTIQSPQFGSSATQGYPLGGNYGTIQLQKAATNTWNVIAYSPGQGAITLSGTCTHSANTGDAYGGTYTMSSAGNCTIIATPNLLPAQVIWTGMMSDVTQPTVPAWGPTSESTTAVTFTVPTAVASGDVLVFQMQRH